MSGRGDADNELFMLDPNGALKTAVVLGFESVKLIPFELRRG